MLKINIDRVIERGFIHGDLTVFAHFLENIFLGKVPADPKVMFKKVCFNFPFQFLIMFDLFIEHACKILMCPCYKDNFKEEGNDYKKYFIHFHSRYDKKHEHFIYFCGRHPFDTNIPIIANHAETIMDKCFCKIEHANQVCEFCCSVGYSLNFFCHKFCVEDSEYFIESLNKHKIGTLDEYLKKVPCKPFFYFKDDRIFVSLDNPDYSVPKKTDSRPVLYRSQEKK